MQRATRTRHIPLAVIAAAEGMSDDEVVDVYISAMDKFINNEKLRDAYIDAKDARQTWERNAQPCREW